MVFPVCVCRYDAEYETYVSKQYSCDLVPQNVRFGSFNPGRNVTEGECALYGRIYKVRMVRAFCTSPNLRPCEIWD